MSQTHRLESLLDFGRFSSGNFFGRTLGVKGHSSADKALPEQGRGERFKFVRVYSIA